MAKVSLREAAALFRRAGNGIDTAIERAERETGAEMLRKARELSEGPVSLLQLAQMDHPYARRHVGKGGKRKPDAPTIPNGTAAIINEQTGKFLANWRYVGIVTDAQGRKVVRVENRSEVAGWLAEGTRKMIARPLPDAVLAAIDQRLRAERIAREINKLLK